MKNQLFGNPGIPGQHIRAQRKANRLLALMYQIADRWGNVYISRHQRRWNHHWRDVQKLERKWDLKIGVIPEAAEEWREPHYFEETSGTLTVSYVNQELLETILHA